MEVWAWLGLDWRIHSSFSQALEDMRKESFVTTASNRVVDHSLNKRSRGDNPQPFHCGLTLKRHAVGVWNWTHWRKGSICCTWPHGTDVGGPQDEKLLTISQVLLILLVQDHTEQTGSRSPDSYSYNRPWYCQAVEFLLDPLLSPGPGVSK